MTTPAQWDYLVQLSIERRRGMELATFFACVQAADDTEAWEKLREVCRRNLTPANGEFLIGCRVYIYHGFRRAVGATVAGMLRIYDKDCRCSSTDQSPFRLPTGCSELVEIGLRQHWTNRMLYRIPGQKYWKRRAKLKLLDCEAANAQADLRAELTKGWAEDELEKLDKIEALLKAHPEKVAGVEKRLKELTEPSPQAPEKRALPLWGRPKLRLVH